MNKILVIPGPKGSSHLYHWESQLEKKTTEICNSKRTGGNIKA
jgi:predicted alpha/beta hydrolase family esterase